MSLLKEALDMMMTEERVVTGEVISPSKHETAAKMAAQFVRLAEKQSGAGTPEGAEVVAKKYAAAFHQALIKEIEDNIRMKSMKRYTHYGEEGSFHRTA